MQLLHFKNPDQRQRLLISQSCMSCLHHIVPLLWQCWLYSPCSINTEIKEKNLIWIKEALKRRCCLVDCRRKLELKQRYWPLVLVSKDSLSDKSSLVWFSLSEFSQLAGFSESRSLIGCGPPLGQEVRFCCSSASVLLQWDAPVCAVDSESPEERDTSLTQVSLSLLSHFFPHFIKPSPFVSFSLCVVCALV